MSKLSPTIREALSLQYAHEVANSLKYRYRQSWAEYRGLTGCAKYFAKEADGEIGHANMVAAYLFDRNEELQVRYIPNDETPPVDFVGVFTSSQVVELATTELIKGLLILARSEGDFQTEQWLFKPDGLMAIQTEEENEIQTILDRIEQYRITGLEDAGIGELIHQIDVWIAEGLE
jgi:ferritin